MKNYPTNSTASQHETILAIIGDKRKHNHTLKEKCLKLRGRGKEKRADPLKLCLWAECKKQSPENPCPRIAIRRVFL